MSSTCALSGIAAPDVMTLAALASGDDSAAVIVSPDCSETQVDVQASTEEPGTNMLNASYDSIEAVASYPKVSSLRLWFNEITSFKAEGTSVKYIDLSSNGITTLDGMEFPSSTQRLIFDLNSISSTRASDFPDSLLSLYLRKNVITSLAKFRFPAALQTLFLTGNTELKSLNGAVFPDTLATLDCNSCGITKIEGVIFPSALKTLSLSGATVTSFEVRESDVAVLQSASVQMTASVSSCSTSGATLTAITDSISACVLDDITFSTLYPDASGGASSPSSTSSGSSSSSAATSSGSSTSTTGSGSSSATAASPSSSTGSTSPITGSSSSSSKAGLIGGIAAGVVVVLLLVLAFVMYRRRKAKQDKAAEQSQRTIGSGQTYQMPPSSNGAGVNSGKASYTHGTDSMTVSGSQPPSSGGYLSNDVRYDESLVPYRLSVDEINVERELAVGGFGVVYLATMQHDKRLVVVKRLKGSTSNDSLRRFMNEIQLCARLDHPKIVRFVGVAWTNLLDLSLVLEFMPRGDLSGLLKRKQKKSPRGSTVAKRRSNSPSDGGNQYQAFDGESSDGDLDAAGSFMWFDPLSKPRNKIDLALDVAEAIVYLHSFPAPIIHRDLKAKNVLLSETYEAKLSDFGVSRERKTGAGGLDDIMENASTMTGGMGTTAWIAPEVLQGERYSEKADIFSFGIVLAELDACGHPYNNAHSDKRLTDAKIAMLVSSDAVKPSLSRDCPPGVRNLLLRCVSFDPRARPSAVELHYELRKLKAAATRDSPSTLSSYHQGFV